MSSRLAVVLLVSAVLSAACGITTPEDNQKDSVNGVVPMQSDGLGQSFHPFTVKKNGEVFVTVTALNPTPTASIGMGIGLTSGAGCSPLTGYVRAVIVNREVEFGYLNRGDYCWLIYDIDVITADTTYTAIISHP